jgi:hypothetical protein
MPIDAFAKPAERAPMALLSVLAYMQPKQSKNKIERNNFIDLIK